MNSKNKNIRDLYRGLNDFTRGYQPGRNFVKDENSDLLADSKNIVNRLKRYFSQLLNIYSVSDVRHMEIHLNHWYLVPVILRLKLLLQSSEL
jgi:hypothetical protein